MRSRPIENVDPLGLLDVFIGGANDDSSHIVSNYRSRFGALNPGRKTLYFEWTQVNGVVEAILAARAANKCEPINMVGHSYGGSTAANLSHLLDQAGIELDLLITIDPVSRTWSQATGVADTWINVNATPSSSNGTDGDLWASLGGKWGDWPSGRANQHYSAPNHHNEFESMLEALGPNGRSALDELISSSSSCSCKGQQ